MSAVIASAPAAAAATGAATGAAAPLVPVMTKGELELLCTLLRSTDRYLEFGTGGSTRMAAMMVRQRITSVDSSAEWLDKVAEACRAPECRVQPDLVRVDIGPVGRWGMPVDEQARDRWPLYHASIWERPEAWEADFCLVDGRFRVACFMQTLLHCRADTLIGIHDFARKQYHVVHEVARQVARVDELAIFVRRADVARQRVHDILERFRFTPK
jgi:hypothetical protein